MFTEDADLDLYRDAYSPLWDEAGEKIASTAPSRRDWQKCSAKCMDDCAEAYCCNDHALRRLHETLKDAIDPNGIISAGGYGIWPRHLR